MTEKIVTKKTARTGLTPDQEIYLRTGRNEDCADRGEIYFWRYEVDSFYKGRGPRAVFEAVRGDYPPGHFAWAEKEFRAKRARR